MGYPIFRQRQLEKNGWKIHERDDDHFLHKGSDICNPTPKTSTYWTYEKKGLSYEQLKTCHLRDRKHLWPSKKVEVLDLNQHKASSMSPWRWGVSSDGGCSVMMIPPGENWCKYTKIYRWYWDFGQCSWVLWGSTWWWSWCWWCSHLVSCRDSIKTCNVLHQHHWISEPAATGTNRDKPPMNIPFLWLDLQYSLLGPPFWMLVKTKHTHTLFVLNKNLNNMSLLCLFSKHTTSVYKIQPSTWNSPKMFFFRQRYNFNRNFLW